jgi:RNA polymerase sigma factor (sigma-70 family)
MQPLPPHQQGQEIGALARDLEAPLKRYFARHGYSASDNEDLIQEVFLRLSKLNATTRIENPQAYTFQIAANVIRDRGRTLRARVRYSDQPLMDSDEPSDEVDPERLLIARQSLAIVQSALMSLPPRTRAVFLLHRYDGLKYKEIANVLGIGVSSVEKHMMQALSHILSASKTS